MQSSKSFVNILLFVVCAAVVKWSSASRVENNTRLFGEKQYHETNKRAKSRGVEETEPLKLERGKRRLNSNPAHVAPKEHDISDGIESKGTNNPFSKTPEPNNPERQNQKIASSKRDAEQMSLQSDILHRKLSKDEVDLYESSNPRKRMNKKMASIHHVGKRNVNTSEPTQPSVTPTSNPPTSSCSSCNIPPVCSGQQSCRGRCTGDITKWRTDENLACYCDTACYEIFNDCCSDFAKFCGVQKPRNISIKKYKWTCEPLGNVPSNQPHCEIGEGLWMISRCADDWPHDQVRSKCENPTKSLRQASNIRRYIPAVSGNFTFRNYFCAKCNHIAGNLDYFPVEIKTNVIPPKHYNFSRKVNFLLSNGAEFPEDGPARPKSSQTRRYCRESMVDSFPTSESSEGNTASESCENGPLALMLGFASCDDPNQLYTCFPSLFLLTCRLTPPQKFLLKLDYKDTYNEEHSVFTVLSNFCGRNGLTYDDKLQECSENLPSPDGKEDKFRILAWFAPSKNFQFTENDFKTVMKQYFGVKDSQMSNTSIDTVPRLDSSSDSIILYHLVSLTLLLSPEQSIDVLFKSNSNLSGVNLGRFIHFEEPFSITLNNITYSIIKTTARPLSCITRKIITPQDYKVFASGKRIYIINMTVDKAFYEKSKYFGEINRNITVCERRTPVDCNTTSTGLTKNDFVINTNLSLYHKETGEFYQLGQYNVLDNTIKLCISNKIDFPTGPTCPSEASCQWRCSKHTETEWQTDNEFRCSCDPDCYEVFHDCCSDYTKYCGAQKPTETLTKKYNYTCEILDLPGCVDKSVWMVTRCRPEWPYDTFRTKCTQPVNYFSSDIYSSLPVIGRDNTTFSNMYCAICNGVKRFESWPIDVETAVIPPPNFNFMDKISFLLSHGATYRVTSPGTNQARRSCPSFFEYERVIDSCPLGENFESCTNGEVAIITTSNSYSMYKNTQCAACHGVSSKHFRCFFQGVITCNEWMKQEFDPYLFSLDLGYSQIETEIKARVAINYKFSCRSGMIFDDILEVCRVNWLSPPKQSEHERFYVYAWLKPPQNSQIKSLAPTEFQNSLAKYLNVSQLQIFDINNIVIASRRSRPFLGTPEFETIKFLFYLVSSTIALTPQQSLELLSINRNDDTTSSTSSEKKLLNYIYFSEAFTLQIKGIPYTVTKTTSRPLACVGKTTYTPEEYTLQDQERVFVPSTNKTYEKLEYYRENAEKLDVKRGNITVCEKYIPAKCNKSIVHYTTAEYIVMVNLSIYINKTTSLYNYGEYEVLSNQSIAICQEFKVRVVIRPRTQGSLVVIHETRAGLRQTIRDNDALWYIPYITFISFLLSILLLIFLLVTYILFPQLRTLPGKNLMNFAVSLLLFQIFWLPSNFTEVRSDKPTCTAMAIMEHYFLMASFVSMSVIAFHTCKVFARSLPAPKMSKGQERKLFCLYLALVWLLPGIFVAICVVLDDQDVVKLGYGESEICWLTENNAYVYFVTIPIAVLLLFNIIAFVVTAVYLRKHSQNTAAKQASGNRRSNLSIYAKLSTLMGFTWLFGLLALVVTSTTAFWYFFVILTSLQGVFVAMAFVVNAKTFGLYKQRYASGSSTPEANPKRRNVPTNINKDTEL